MSPLGTSKARPTKKAVRWHPQKRSTHFTVLRAPRDARIFRVPEIAVTRTLKYRQSETMDFAVHRLRFSDWQPSAIKTLASDPFSCKLAVGREDGDIEIRDASHQWYVQATAPGQKGFNLQALTWAAEKSESGRLFGISLRGFVFELDLSTLKIKNVRDSYGGAAWCMASCPRHCILAIGCEDGAARLFRYDGGVLEYARSLPTTGARILCVAFHPVLPRIFMGCDDGCIRCFDEDTGRSLFTMVGDVVRGVSTYIWSLKVLSDSTIVTGDSRGHVQLWDGETGVLMITLHQHTAEILALAVSPDETQIFASGVDCRVTCVRKVAAKLGTITEEFSLPSDNNWVYSTSHNPHSHDVFALEVCNSTSPSSSGVGGAVLISGGMDTKMCSYSIDEFARTRPFCILPVSATGLIQTSTEYDTVAVKHQNRIDLWNMKSSTFEAAAGQKRKIEDQSLVPYTEDDDESRCKLALRLEMKGPEHIHCFALSSDGQTLSCSTTTETRIWALKQDSEGFSVEKLALPAVARGFCHAVAFSADGRRVAAYTAKGDLLLLSLTEGPVEKRGDTKQEESDDEEDDEREGESDNEIPRPKKNKKSVKPVDNTVEAEMETQVKLWHSFDHSEVVKDLRNKGSQGSGSAAVAEGLESVVTQIVFSADGMYLAVADAQNTVYVYDIDRLRLHWRLPLLTAPVTALAFDPKSNATLVVAQADNTFLVYEADEMRLGKWSTKNSVTAIKQKLSAVNSPISAVTFDPSAECSMILYSHGCLVYVDLTLGIPLKTRTISHSGGGNSITDRGRGRFTGRGSRPPEPPHDSRYGPGGNREVTEPAVEQAVTLKYTSSYSSNFAVIMRYKSLVHVGCAPGRQLVIFENPWVNVLANLPDTLTRKRYGT